MCYKPRSVRYESLPMSVKISDFSRTEICEQCSSLKWEYAFRCEGLRNNSHFTFKFLCNTSPTKTWYWAFCTEYEINMMSCYFEEEHATIWCTNIIQISYITHLIIIQLQTQSPLDSFVNFQVSKIRAQSIIPLEYRIMTFTSMHSMCQVLIDFNYQSSPNHVSGIQVSHIT